MDQLIINGKGSYELFEANVSEVDEETLKIKTIRESVPFSNREWDFSRINEEPFFESRKVTYVLELTGDSVEEMNEKKWELLDWLYQTHNAIIENPYKNGRHYVGDISGIKAKDDIEKTTVEATFLVFPYMFIDKPAVFEAKINEIAKVVKVLSKASHAVPFRVKTTKNCQVTLREETFTVSPAIPYNSVQLKVQPGMNDFKIKSLEGDGKVTISFVEEVI